MNRLLERVRQTWRQFAEIYEGIFFAPYRHAVARRRQQEEDLFILLCFSELLGLPNPVSFYTLELYPVLYRRFHDWHRRMGMEKSPIEGLR